MRGSPPRFPEIWAGSADQHLLLVRLEGDWRSRMAHPGVPQWDYIMQNSQTFEEAEAALAAKATATSPPAKEKPVTEDNKGTTMSPAAELDPTQQYNALIESARAAATEGRHADAARAYHDALLILEDVFGPDNDMVVAVADALARSAFAAGDHALDEQAQRRLLAYALRRYGREHTEPAFIMNNLAFNLREQDKFEEAEDLARDALAIDEGCRQPDDPKIPHRLNNLATVLILRGGHDRLTEAATLNARAWKLKSRRHDITSLRILVNRLRLAMLTASETNCYIGQLKMLLLAPSLGSAGNVSLSWDCASLVRQLQKPGPLARQQADVLLALLRVLSGQAPADSLNELHHWRKVDPIPLETPWPDLAPPPQ